jgi:hypothetical protein
MLTNREILIRPVSLAARLLDEYGADLPEPVAVARRAYLDLAKERPTDPDMRAIGATALDKTPSAAAKALQDARLAIDVHAAALDVAAERLSATLREHDDEVISAVLSAPALVAAVEEIATVAPTVRSDVPREPVAGGASSEDEIIAAARLRRAEAVIDTAAQRLNGNDFLGVTFDESEAGLLFIDPSEIPPGKDFGALRRALGGVRPGFIPRAVYVPSSPGSTVPVTDRTPLGIRSAIAAAVPGVSFRLVSSYDDYLDRVRLVEHGGRGHVAEPEARRKSPVVL